MIRIAPVSIAKQGQFAQAGLPW